MTNGTIHTERLLTTDEVAERLSVSPQTVRRLYYAGTLPGLRLGKRLRFTVEDVQGYLGQAYSGTPAQGMGFIRRLFVRG